MALSMNYDAASRGRRTLAWAAPGSSADAAAGQGARERIRNMARDFVRNRPYAHRGLEVITSNVVGSGIAFSAANNSPARKVEVEKVLRQFFRPSMLDAQGQHGLAAMQRMVMNATVEDGEVLIRRRWRRGSYAKDLPLPFQVEVLEADYLDTWKTGHAGNPVIDGVEFGPTGRIEAYHLWREHPGGTISRFNLQSTRVPAADIIHVRRADRPGQARGVSWFAPVMLTLGDLSDYQESEIVKQKMAALMVGFIESEEDTSLVSATSDEAAEQLGLQNLEPGTFVELAGGQKINFSTPPTVQGTYDPFMRQNLAAVAVGLGITYEALTGDMTRVNFSSGRMGRMEMDRNIEAWQQLIMIGQFCEGLEGWIDEAWHMRPALGPADLTLSWTAPRRVLIDPTKEIPAMIKEVDAGLTSRRRAQRQLGRDPDVIRQEIAEDRAEDRAAEQADPATETE